MTTKTMTKTMIMPVQRPKNYISLRVRMLVAFTLVFLVFFTMIFALTFVSSTNSAMNQIRAALMSALSGGIDGINGDDFEALSKLSAPEGKFPSNRLYYDHQRWLEQINKLEPRAFPYTLAKTDEPRTGLWVGDILRIVRSPHETGWLESYSSDTSKLFDGFLTETVNLEPYTDKWGSWISAYTPIQNSKGDYVGVFGVDFKADYVWQVQSQVRDSVLATFALAFPSLLVVIFFVTRAIARPIARLKGAAEELGDGRYDMALDLLFTIRTHDEIGVLSSVFRAMADKVRGREETLNRKVEELTIQIDIAKRDKQVAEVTESEFFRDLQVRVRALRVRQGVDSVTQVSEPNVQPATGR